MNSSVAPVGLAVQEQHDLTVGITRVDVVHPHPVDLGVVRLQRIVGQALETVIGCPHERTSCVGPVDLGVVGGDVGWEDRVLVHRLVHVGVSSARVRLGAGTIGMDTVVDGAGIAVSVRRCTAGWASPITAVANERIEIMSHPFRWASTSSSGVVGEPRMATRSATPMTAPTWRKVLLTAPPIDNLERRQLGDSCCRVDRDEAGDADRDDFADQDEPEGFAVDADELREAERGSGHDERSDDHQGPESDAGRQTTRERGEDRHGDRRERGQQSGVEHRIAPRLSKEQHVVQRVGGEAAHEHERRGVRHAERLALEEREVEDRLRMMPLPADEQWNRGNSCQQHRRRARIAPAPHLRSGEAERDAGERERDQQGTAVVGSVLAVDAWGLHQDATTGDEHRRGRSAG